MKQQGVLWVMAVMMWIVMSLSTLPEAQAQYTVVHSFTGSSDGAFPHGSLIQSGSTLYGMTGSGSNYGTIFKISSDGSGFSILHSFTGSSNDGSGSNGSLTLSGSILYGMTYMGGNNGQGTVFKINTDGTSFSLLHSFTEDSGANPSGDLTLSGSTLYGMTVYGGSSRAGTIFKISTDGSGFSVLHTFTGGTGDGAYPYGSLILTGSTLYGMTSGSGSSEGGIIFQVNTDGSNYHILHNFNGSDGSKPFGSLTLSGSTLYGMTRDGGSGNFGNGYGTIFKINVDGSDYSVLYNFNGNDGSGPNGSLLLSGTTLYGMTTAGGNWDCGTIFQINTDGTSYSVLHTFDNFSSTDGASPYGSLVQSDTSLYGLTSEGGVGSGNGAIFRLIVPSLVSYVLTTGVIGGHGTLSPSDGSFSSGNIVSLSAQPDIHYYVKQWIGTDNDSSILTTNSVTMTKDKTVTVEFEFGYAIKTSTDGQGSITTSSSRTHFTPGEQTTLEAVPQSGWMFDHWSGDLTGSTNPVDLTVIRDMTVKAVFVKKATLSILKIGQGTIALNPVGQAYVVNTQVTMTATPADGWTFRKWSGDLDSSSNPVTIAMNKDKMIQAEFVSGTSQNNSYILSVFVTGKGSVTPSSGIYNKDSQVTLKATPADGWTFAYWAGDLSKVITTPTLDITMYADQGYTAVFTQKVSENTDDSTTDNQNNSTDNNNNNGSSTDNSSTGNSTGNNSTSNNSNLTDLLDNCSLPSAVILLAVFAGFTNLRFGSRE